MWRDTSCRVARQRKSVLLPSARQDTDCFVLPTRPAPTTAETLRWCRPLPRLPYVSCWRTELSGETRGAVTAPAAFPASSTHWNTIRRGRSELQCNEYLLHRTRAKRHNPQHTNPQKCVITLNSTLEIQSVICFDIQQFTSIYAIVIYLEEVQRHWYVMHDSRTQGFRSDCQFDSNHSLSTFPY